MMVDAREWIIGVGSGPQEFAATRPIVSKGVRMSDTARKVDYFYVVVPDKPGEGAKVLSALAAAGINLLAFCGFPSARKGQLDLIPEDTAAFKVAAKTLKLKLSPRKTGFLVQGDDRVGAMNETLDKLADAKINITAMSAISSGGGLYGAIFWVKPEAVARAAKLLGAR
jgi:prephenate dehydratase